MMVLLTSVMFAAILLSGTRASPNVTDSSIDGGTDFGTGGGTDFGTGGTDFVTGELPTCATTTCPDNAVCKDTDGYVFCDCPIDKTGPNCDLPNPCMKNTTNCPAGKMCFGDCPPNIICEGATGVAHCRGCVLGWTGPMCDEDEDECTMMGGSPCYNDGVCMNTIGSYKCTCKGDWTGSDCSCKKGDVCDIQESREDPSGTASTMSHHLVTLFFFLPLIILK